MRAVEVTFACGHPPQVIAATHTGEVQCPQCGMRRVRAVSAPVTRIKAVECPARGPHVVQEK